jgi:hypothetical protein
MKVLHLLALSATLFAFNTNTQSQLNYEIGTEITAASFSTFGGTAGGGLKFAITTDEGLAFGPSFRYQYFWSKNNFTGQAGSGSIYGGGVFLHYRFMDWFFVGTEIEILKNPFGGTNLNAKRENWTPTMFIGLGMSKDFPINDYPIRINLGLFYDVYDGVRDDLNSQPSPLRNNYFLKIADPINPNLGRYLPFIYRIAFFFPLTRN